jgi:CHAT domain-containing protein
MRRGGKQRHHPGLRALSLLLLLAACARGVENPTEDPYQQAVAEFRRGNLAAAQAVVDKAKTRWADQTQSVPYWQYRVLQAEILISQANPNQALQLLDAQPPAGPGFETVASRWNVVRAKALRRLKRPAEAHQAVDAAEALAQQTKQRAVLPEIYNVRGSVFDTARQYPEAETAYQAGLRYAEEFNEPYWQTLILNNLGLLRFNQSRYDEALPLLVRARDGLEELGAKLALAGTLTNIAVCAGYLGDFDRASTALLKAAEVLEKEGAKPSLHQTLGEIGNLYMFESAFANAIPYYQRALNIALEIDATTDASKWAGNLAVAFSELKNWNEAEKFNTQARQLKEKIKDVASLANIRLNAADIARGRGQIALAERLYGEAMQESARNTYFVWAHAGLAQLYRESGDKKKAYEHFDAAIRAIDATRAELTAEYKITFQSRLIRFYQQYVDALVEQNALNRALEVAESSRARVLAERFRLSGKLQHVSADSFAQAARQSGTTFVSYWLAPVRSFMWVITPKGQKFFVLPPKSEIEQLVQSYQAIVDASRDPLESVPPAANRLYEILIAPARDLVAKGASVVLVPDGGLHNLNFETLPVPADKPYYWIEDATISIAPSLAANVGGVKPGPLKSLLLIGDPETAGTEYQPLPYAATESRNVEQRLARLQQAVFTGPRAEPMAYLNSEPAMYSVIHFAAHAVANRESPLDSAIILSSSSGSFKLYARNVMDTPLQAELVTISACRGAGARVYSGEGLVGFTWAFLQAGARNVIAGLWDVTDKSTAQLMDRLYEEINAGKSPAEALRQAKLSLIHSDNNFRKPYYWGAFQIYVGGGRR